ncbi:hypothetical protein D3C87_865240 [compost metagenome]
MSKVKAVKTPQVKMELGGKSRTLKYDLNSFAELELKYGSVEKAMQALQSGSVIAAKNMLWAGLIHEEAVLDEVTGEPIKYNITPYQVGSWMSASDIENIGDLINNAMTSSLVQPEAKPVEIAPTAQSNIAQVVLTPEEKAEREKNL